MASPADATGAVPLDLASQSGDPAWPQTYARWRHRVGAALGTAALGIEHVGSTSVPGLAAKPIVDIQVSVADLADELRYVPQLEKAGLVLRSRDELHRYFRPPAGQPREVHVHVCAAGSQWERDHQLFRDYLRADPAACRRYAEAKRANIRRWSDDGWAYTEAKTSVVLDVLEQATDWARSRTGRPHRLLTSSPVRCGDRGQQSTAILVGIPPSALAERCRVRMRRE